MTSLLGFGLLLGFPRGFLAAAAEAAAVPRRAMVASVPRLESVRLELGRLPPPSWRFSAGEHALLRAPKVETSEVALASSRRRVWSRLSDLRRSDSILALAAPTSF